MQKEDAAQKAVASILDVLEAYLLHESFLAGHKVTLADIIAVCILQPAYAKVRPRPLPARASPPHHLHCIGHAAPSSKDARADRGSEAMHSSSAADPLRSCLHV